MHGHEIDRVPPEKRCVRLVSLRRVTELIRETSTGWWAWSTKENRRGAGLLERGTQGEPVVDAQAVEHRGVAVLDVVLAVPADEPGDRVRRR